MGAAWDSLLDGHVRTLIEREALAPFLARQRWFGGKARRIRTARFVDWGLLRRGGRPMFLTIVEVTYDDGGAERYFVPLTIVATDLAERVMAETPFAALARVTGARKGLITDAGTDEEFATAVLQALEQQQDVRTKRAVIHPDRTPVFDVLRGDGTLAPHRLTLEQSNTSIAYGGRLIAKLFRRVERGPNPDVEIGEHLTVHTDFRRAPRVAGAFEYQEAGRPSPIWWWCTSWCRARRTAGRTRWRSLAASSISSRGTASRPKARCRRTTSWIDVHPHAGGRGRCRGRLHRYSTHARSPYRRAAPGACVGVDRSSVHAGASVRSRRRSRWSGKPARKPGVRSISSGSVPTSSRSRRLRDHLLARAEQVLTGPHGLVPDLTGARTRVHGDYHLGQVLWAEGDFYILDFEGEPSRSLEDRRMKESPLRDVAGMLRSFSYAAYAALFSHTAARKSEFERLERWARVWQTWASAAFLKGYMGPIQTSAVLPAAPAQQRALLDLFLLDKALYELKYELNNRPDWLRIPLRGIEDLLA